MYHNRNNFIKLVVFSVLLFQYLFRPPWAFTSINLDNVVILLSLVYLVANAQNSYQRKLIIEFKIPIIIILGLSIYLLVIGIGFQSIFPIYQIYSLFFKGIVVPLAGVVFICKNFDSPFKTFNRITAAVLLAQGIFAIICLVSYEIKIFLNTEILRMGQAKEFTSVSALHRGNGFAQSYLFIMPMLTAVLTVYLAFIFTLRRNSYFWISLFCSLLICLVNARIAVLFLLFNLVVISLFGIGLSIKKAFQVIASLAVSLFVLILVIGFFNWFDYNFNWFVETFDFLIYGYEGSKVATLINFLLLSFIVPDSMGLFFGTGEHAFYYISERGLRTDVGYSIQLFTGGLVYLMGLFAVYISLFRSFLKILNFKVRHFAIILCLFISILVANLKGDILSNGTFLGLNFFSICLFYGNLIINKQIKSTNNTFVSSLIRVGKNCG